MRTISAWWVAAMAETFKWHGLPLTRLFNKANIPLDSLGAAHNRYPQANVSELWTQAQALCPHLNLAIEVGKAVNVRALPIVGMAMLHMDSVADAFALMLRYQKLMGGNTNARVIEHDSQLMELRFQFNNDLGAVPVQSYEAAMAFCVKVARTVADSHWRPIKVCLGRANPCPHAQQYFDCELEFASAYHQIFFTNDALNASSAVQPQYEVTDNKPITQALTLVLEQYLPTGEVACAHVAARFGMSAKTLQRRLTAEGTSYRAQLESVRKQKSHALLNDTQLTISEIAYLCGYSEISAFHHAFTRWYGTSPSHYRGSV